MTILAAILAAALAIGSARVHLGRTRHRRTDGTTYPDPRTCPTGECA